MNYCSFFYILWTDLALFQNVVSVAPLLINFCFHPSNGFSYILQVFSDGPHISASLE